MSDDTVKLCDFGLSINIYDERPVTRLGTLQFMAPECLRGITKNYPQEGKDRMDIRIGTPSDIWSLGILVYELLAGTTPFMGSTADEMLESLHAKVLTMDKFSLEASDLILKCLHLDPERRPTASALLNHVIFKKHSGPRRPSQQHSRGFVGKAPSMPRLMAQSRPAPTSPSQHTIREEEEEAAAAAAGGHGMWGGRCESPWGGLLQSCLSGWIVSSRSCPALRCLTRLRFSFSSLCCPRSCPHRLQDLLPGGARGPGRGRARAAR